MAEVSIVKNLAAMKFLYFTTQVPKFNPPNCPKAVFKYAQGSQAYKEAENGHPIYHAQIKGIN